MPDTRITSLTELAEVPAANDVLVVVDVSDTTMATSGTDKKIQYSNVAAVPVGSVLDFAGSTAPTGWLLCDGASLLRAGIYAGLFAVIGTTYGAADGTHFNVPDLRGRVAAGKDNMGGTAANRLTSTWGVNGATLGANGGAESHQLTIAQMPAHGHIIDNFFTNVGGTLASSGGLGQWQNKTAQDTGGGNSHHNVQPTLVLNKIIRY